MNLGDRPVWFVGEAGVALVLGIVLFGIGRGRASGDDRLAADSETERRVAEARSQVAVMEARVREAAANLKKARELLAQLEGNGRPAPVLTTKKEADPGEDDTGRLEGVWRIVSINGNFGGEFRKPPYDEYKIMTANHYLWLSFDPETGKVIRSGGGTYSLKGEMYTAHIDYSNSEDLRAVVGQDYTGTCKLDGKRWYHYGRVPSGGVFDELWERVH